MMGLKLLHDIKLEEFMDSILNRLPIIFGAFAGILAGVIGIAQKRSANEIYKIMIIFIVIFIIAGVILRRILYSILVEQNRKRKENEKLSKEQKISESETDKNKQSDSGSSKIDIVVDDNEEFTPLELSKAVKTKMNESASNTKEK